MRPRHAARHLLAVPALLLVLAAFAEEPSARVTTPWMIVPLVEAGPEVGIGGGAQFLHANILGGKEFFRLVAEGSSEGQEWYEMEYEDPAIAGSAYAAHARALRRIVPNRRFFGYGGRTDERDETDHKIKSSSVSLRMDHRLTERVGAWGALSYRDVRTGTGALRRVTDTSTRFPDLPGIEGGHVLAASGGAVLDRVVWYRNTAGYDVYPRSGGRLEGAIETSGLDTGDFQKTQFHIAGSAYRPLAREGHVLCARIAADTVPTRQSAFWDMPSLGGRDTLRGYIDDRFVGPYRLYANLEHRFPLFEGHVNRIVQGLHGALFVDVGRVWARHEPLTLTHLAANGGVGLR
ncbi:MAG: BamA/TamA family outer membrane protein, partial [Planctomycetes bacterium]|nr:BamA/TamA family outer membrane protein [Planctomycetota bacterium]